MQEEFVNCAHPATILDRVFLRVALWRALYSALVFGSQFGLQ